MSSPEPDEILQGLLRRLDDGACLSGRLLERLVVDALPAAEAEATMAHVTSCLVCLNTFSRLQGLHAIDDSRPGLVGDSAAVRSLRAHVTRLAAMDEAPVLIAGERGTGKGVVARDIHALSRRAAGPFVEVSCTATPTARLEEKLPDVLAAAAGGTLFLDEVDALSPALQAAVLGLIDAPAQDVRVVAATHVDPDDLARGRAFSADLLARFAVSTVTLPPLRERRDDIVPLARHFADRLARRHGGVLRLTRDAEARLRGYRWPGNVRELVDVIERAARRRERDEIGVEALQLPASDTQPLGGARPGSS
jgi:DNA-binding NtrC family response regulator